ncbi:MAG: ATP-binding protein, partial [Phycisphaerae bacterium]
MTDNRSSTTGAELPLAACHHAIVQSSLDCIITIDHLGNIIEFNPAAEHTFQLKKADVIGQSMVDLIVPPALRAAHRHGMKRFMQTGKSEVLGRRIELTAIRSDGTEFPVELAITPIDIDTENPVFTACLRDITDRVERERAKSRMQELQAISQEVVSGFLEKEDLVPTIKNMLQRLGEFFDASHAQILRIRDNGSRVYCTHEWCHVDGKPTIGCLQGFDAAHLDDRFPGVRNGKMAMDTGQVTPDDKQVPQAQDKVDFKATVAWPLRIEGEVELILLIADSRKLQAWSKEEISTVQLLSESLSRAIERRIAERKRVLAAQQIQDALQEAEKANAIKSDFLANMSHEIRTPLAAILGYVDLMRKQMGSDQSLVELFQVVESNGHHLDQLLCDLLDISRIEAGILPIEPRDCRLDQLLALICAEYDHRAQSAGLNFRFVSQGDIPRFVFADPVRLHQILANLLTNAVKYTNSGSIELAVSAESGHDDTAIIRFSVTDTGTGIPDEIRSVIFERFHQGPPHNDDTQRGVGLGLAIVRNMVDLLGGTIELQTVSGQGTTFDVEFPVRRAWDWQQVSRDSLRLAESSSQMSESGLRGAILIVDDSDDLLHLCK